MQRVKSPSARSGLFFLSARAGKADWIGVDLGRDGRYSPQDGRAEWLQSNAFN